MKTMKQLLRQPLKALFGIVLMALAVAILCTTSSQAAAAKKLQEQMEYQFVTTALPTSKYQTGVVKGLGMLRGEKYELLQEKITPEAMQKVDEWTRATAAAHPELVKCVSSPGLASAYIPELVADNRCSYRDNFGYMGDDNADYLMPEPEQGQLSCVILEIELEKIYEPIDYPAYIKQEDGTVEEDIKYTWLPIEGRILGAYGLQEGYSDPLGFSAQIAVDVTNLEDLFRLDLVPGERYLVYGRNYFDYDWVGRNAITDVLNLKELLDAVDPEGISLHSWCEPRAENENKYTGYFAGEVGTYTHESRTMMLSASIYSDFWTVTLNAEDRSRMPRYNRVNNAEGGYLVPDTDWYRMDEEGNRVLVSQEEFVQRYQTPTIAHLTGTAEAFMGSPEGALWQEMLDEIQLTHRTFAMIGVDRLGYIGGFAREDARIVDGRDFTTDELEKGEKVCVLSEYLAATNGLKVGDTISPRFYNYDRAVPYQHFLKEGVGTLNPVPVFHGRTTPWVGEAEEYTIVGLYRQKELWEDPYLNIYAFTPNTIFVPKNAVTSDMDYGTVGVFRTVVLKNGTIPQFQTLVNEAGYDGLFAYYDHGYSLVAYSLQDYQAVAKQTVEIGCIIYSAILLLFLLLFPGMQKKNVMIMDSLGADRKQKIRHVMGSSLGVLVPGTLIGALTGALLWQTVTEKLSSETMELAIPIPTLLLTAAAQLLAAAALVFLIALPITKSRGLAKRK